MYKTQKARGLEIAWNLNSLAGYGYTVPPVYGVFPHIPIDDIKKVFERETKNPLFARPCPVTPRHGFVESRIVADYAQFEKTVKETLDQDPDGEVILMEKLTGKYSAVMVSTGVTWGQSNDGVTSGKGKQFVIPCPAGTFDRRFLATLGVKTKDWDNMGVYAELVENDGHVAIVQMRLGPKQPDSRQKRITVSATTVIKQIITLDDLGDDKEDLIKWDKVLQQKLASYLNPASILVHLPGQALSSHFAVQAITKGFNVSVEDECPAQRGEKLQAASNETVQLEDKDYKSLAKYFKEYCPLEFIDHPRNVLQSIGTLHAIPYWGTEPHLLRLRAYGAVLAARYSLAACLGEARHKPRRGDLKNAVDWTKLLGTDKFFNPTRGYVFLRAFSLPWSDCAALANAAAADMVLDGHPRVMDYLKSGGKLNDGKYGAGVLGMKWEWAAIKSHDLIVAIDRFVSDPNKDNWLVILDNYNAIINASHNNGNLFNKWCSSVCIDAAATSPALVFGYSTVMSLIFGIKQKQKGLTIFKHVNELDKNKKDQYHKTLGGAYVPKEVWNKIMLYLPIGCSCNACTPWGYMHDFCKGSALPTYVPGNVLEAFVSGKYLDQSVFGPCPHDEEASELEDEEI